MVKPSNRFSFHSIKVEITLGFIVILLISALLGGIGWHSLYRFSEGVSQSETMNLWVSTLIKLRRYEREFKIYQNSDQMLLMQSEISSLQSKIDSARSQFSDPEDTVFLDSILQVTDKYQSSFENYVQQQQDMNRIQATLEGAVVEMESSFSRLARENGDRYHLLNQQLENRWELFLKDLDERASLESFRRIVSDLDLQSLAAMSISSSVRASNIELSADLTRIAHSLLYAVEEDQEQEVQVYQKLLIQSRLIQVLVQDHRVLKRKELDKVYDAITALLKPRQLQIERQMRTHRLQYDVSLGQLTRSKAITEAAKQLQLWSGDLQRQEKEFLLQSRQENAARVRNRIRQIRLSTEDTLSVLTDKDSRQLLSSVLTILASYSEHFDQFQSLIDDRRQADRDMVDAISELQAISRNAAEERRTRLDGWYQTAQRQMLIGSIAVFAVALLISFLIGRRLSHPITSITDTISQVAAGQHEVKTPGLGRRDEIGKMAAAVEVFKQTLVKTLKLQEQQAEENRARCRAEAEVRALNADLEARVIRRTEQLQTINGELEKTLATLTAAQKQLVESEKMAALSGLVAGVAHELNTPLGNCITALSLMTEQLIEVQQAFKQGQLSRQQMTDFFAMGEDVSRIANENLDRAASLIRSFKTLALDAEESEASQYPLAKVIEDSFISLNHILEPAGYEVECQCDSALTIYGYPSDLFQIISNLVTNSVTHAYSSGESGNLDLQVERRNNQIELRYRDDGCGMSEDQQQKIFDPFFTTDRGQGGTGLGMHLVYNLVTQRLKGQIQCSSVLGEGTEFIIQIPFDSA
ncbi:MAG: ATP-binding protein [Motiliproteus sp.]|nr:ATP-binding protein [Motiliproteus sp.]MCW9052102.1 ATP-binding protein [Motiliproteus sp.]